MITRQKPQITQGHRKQLQRINDLFENRVFLEQIQKIKILPDEQINLAITKLCKKYGLEMDYFGTELLMHVLYGHQMNLVGLNFLDMCVLNDDWDENLNPVFTSVPIKYDTRRKLRYVAYPVSIGISPKASQGDVIDFVKKRWGEIRDHLDTYEENPKRIRIRPKEFRNKFIWENRDKRAEDIADLWMKKFPAAEVIGVETVYKTLSLERKKRSEK